MKLKRQILFIQLVILAGLQSAHRSVLIPILRPMIRSFNTTFGFGGLLIGIYMFLAGLAALGWAIYSDYTGLSRRLLILIGILGNIVFTALSITTDIPILFALFYILAGMSISVISPLATTIILDLARREARAGILMTFALFSGFGYAFGFGLGIITVAMFGDWKLPILIIMLLMMIISLPFAMLLKEPPKGFSEEELHDVLRRTYRYPFTLRPEDLKIITGNRSNIYIVLQGVFGIIGSGAIEVWMLQYLIAEAGVNEVVASVIMGLGAIGSIGGLIIAKIADILSRRTPRARPIIAATCSSITAFAYLFFLMIPLRLDFETNDFIKAVQTLFVMLTTNPLLLTAIMSFFIAMVVNSSIGSIKVAVLSEVNLPEHRATVISGTNIIELLSKSISIAILGLLVDFFHSFRIPLIIAVSMWFISALYWGKTSITISTDVWKLSLLLKERRELLVSPNKNS